MDVDKFINLMYGHKCLWDQRDSTYHLRDHQRKAWREISDEIKMPVDDLKKKWRGLRDTFGKELKKVCDLRSTEAADREHDSKWCHFRQMSFLQGMMSRRDLQGSLPEVLCETVETEDNSADTSDFHSSPSPDIPKKIFKSSLKKKLKRNLPDEIDTKLLEIEDRKLKLFQEAADDTDAQFLLSLLPFLKDIPKHRKLTVRSKLQQVLIDEQNDISSRA